MVSLHHLVTPLLGCFLVLSPLYWEDLTFIFSFIDCFAFRQLYCFLTLSRHIPWDTPSILSPFYWDDLIFIFSLTDSFVLRQWYCILTTSRHTPFGMLPRFDRLSTERTWLYPFLYILFCCLSNDIVSLHHLVTSLLGCFLVLSPLYWEDLTFIFSFIDCFAFRQWYSILALSRHIPFGMLPWFCRLSTERTRLYPFLYRLFCF